MVVNPEVNKPGNHVLSSSNPVSSTNTDSERLKIPESSIVHCPYTWGVSCWHWHLLGGAPHVVVRTLKVSLDQHFFFKEGV